MDASPRWLPPKSRIHWQVYSISVRRHYRFSAGIPSDKVACRVELTLDKDAAQTLEIVAPGHFSFGPSVLGLQPFKS